MQQKAPDQHRTELSRYSELINGFLHRRCALANDACVATGGIHRVEHPLRCSQHARVHAAALNSPETDLWEKGMLTQSGIRCRHRRRTSPARAARSECAGTASASATSTMRLPSWPKQPPSGPARTEARGPSFGRRPSPRPTRSGRCAIWPPAHSGTREMRCSAPGRTLRLPLVLGWRRSRGAAPCGRRRRRRRCPAQRRRRRSAQPAAVRCRRAARAATAEVQGNLTAASRSCLLHCSDTAAKEAHVDDGSRLSLCRAWIVTTCRSSFQSLSFTE